MTKKMLYDMKCDKTVIVKMTTEQYRKLEVVKSDCSLFGISDAVRFIIDNFTTEPKPSSPTEKNPTIVLEEPVEKSSIQLPPPGFSQAKIPPPPLKKTYNYYINQGYSPADAYAAVQNGK